jgi:beta-lactamase regulating signal transducer with metallopeptidase domain/5-hydroxyisourate hydrolase-like protein (transthyretin family)
VENLLNQITNYLLTQSWQIAVLIAVIAAVNLALKNKSAHVRYLLWLIVLAKCLMPPLFTVPVAVLPQPAPPVPVETVVTLPAEPAVAPATPVVASPMSTVAERPVRFTTRQWLGFGWVVGVAAFVLFAVIKALRTNFWLWRQRKPLPAELQIEIENLFSSLEFRTLPKVWLLDGIGQPFIWGLLRGSIYLPTDFVKVNNAEQRKGVLGHELSHVIRIDAAVNILQIIAQAVFWFHPFVWWANKRIRAEREKCCDEMVIAHLGAKTRDYSDAIVNILISEHESTRPVPSLAVAGPVKNIEERIKTILRPGKKFHKRPSWRAITVSLLVAILAVPTTVALTKRMEGAESPGGGQAQVTVTGKVISEETGKALIGVLVRVAVPATNMRMVRGSTDHTIYETQTDQQGRFQFEVPLDENTADISLDAFLPGYRSAAGTFRGGGDFRLAKVPVQPNKQIDFLIRLPLALYIAGVAKDHNGRPFAGVQVEGTMRFDRGSGGIARTSTDQNGRFEIFDYPVPAKKRKDERGRLVFRVETAKTVTINDIYKMTPKQMRSLNVQMPRGLVASGVLLDVNGKPVGETTVQAMAGPAVTGIVLRSCKTDQNGRFRLAGLPERKPLTLYAHAMSLKQKAKLTLVLVDRDKEVILRCETVEPKAPLKTVTMLGMKVADVTPEIKEIYDLPPALDGVVILDPGKDHGRLGIGELREGYFFWIVGNKKIHNVWEMIAEILRINYKPRPTRGGAIREGHRERIRVVYVKKGGTNTQYLKLTDEDADELMSLTKELERTADKSDALSQKSKQGSDIADRVISASILSRLGKALLIYANDHQDRFPDTISQVEPYIRDKQDIEWIVQNVVYLGKGKTIAEPLERPLAYDRAMLTMARGTNVLFHNCMVIFRSPEQLEKLGISRPKEALGEVIGQDPADVAVYKQLETIIVDLSELTPTASLSDAIDVIRNSVDPPLKIVVLWRDLLVNADIEPGTAINMDGLPAVLLGTGLESLLKAVTGGFAELGYVVQHGVITIATIETLPSKLEPRIYDISDLVKTYADTNVLIHRITETIEPDSWFELSERGEGTITPYPLQQPKNFAVLQTRKIHQKIKRLLEDMHPSQGDQEKTKSALQVEDSARKLSNLGHALLIYANDHDDKYPLSLRRLRDYLNLEEFNWALANIEYLAHGKTIAVRPDTVIAYDKKLLAERKGTNVLFNDSHVEFVKPERLKELGISATEILIETRFLMVSEEFLKDIGLDPNSVHDANPWSALTPGVLPTSIGPEDSGLILDDLQVSFLLRATQAHKGARVLTAPSVTVLDGKRADFTLHKRIHYISGYAEPNRPSGKPEIKHDSVNKGLQLQLTPIITPDDKHILLDVDFKLSEVIGFEKRMYKEKYPYEIPKTEIVSLKRRIAVPDGGTLLIGDQKITAEFEKEAGVPILSKVPFIGRLFHSRSKIKEQRMLLILVKPTILPREQAEAVVGEERVRAKGEEHA